MVSGEALSVRLRPRSRLIAPGYRRQPARPVVQSDSVIARLQTYLLSIGPFRSPSPRPIRKVLVIGIHGWAVLGGRMFSWSPSTMSMSLARSMGAAVRQRLAVSDQNAIDLTHISLFGHGLVDSRLNDYLLEHLPEYERSIRECDALLVAAHSQGVVLAGLLMEALLDQGWIAPGRQSHLGLLCMAGVHHGPFPDLPTDQFPATTELFSLGHPYAAVASRSLHAITRLLTAQVRIIAICAYMDSVVPLFSSAIHSVTSHPNLLRAIYTTDESDGFPVRLVAFCLEWRNLRSEQSDLLPHLSGFYRGSFFDRRGSHTTIHEERGVYDLAAEWVLSAPVAASNTDQAESALAQHTSAHWAIYLNDAFYYSDLNTYFIR
uniref:YMC020W-like alpha/beta hydrolase domain-containing protein n=1 Tax=Spongospora subterranea TaxID=70186 RepID=A0A0H5QJN9_9EUKA|eukprot:CRZ01837.1 hypothetical protein [Spongospora subterranea]